MHAEKRHAFSSSPASGGVYVPDVSEGKKQPYDDWNLRDISLSVTGTSVGLPASRGEILPRPAMIQQHPEYPTKRKDFITQKTLI